MAHSTPSLMIPPSLSTSSFLTCTPIRPSTRPPTGPMQISPSDEICHCDDPTNVSLCSLADPHSPTKPVLCSRKMCTAQSSTLLRKSTPLPNHSLRCFWATPTAPTVAFLLRLAVDIHSTTAFLSPVISTSNPLVFVGGSSTMGVKISRLHASKFPH